MPHKRLHSFLALFALCGAHCSAHDFRRASVQDSEAAYSAFLAKPRGEAWTLAATHARERLRAKAQLAEQSAENDKLRSSLVDCRSAADVCASATWTDTLADSVFRIEVLIWKDVHGSSARALNVGTGFVVSEDGVAVTARHVLDPTGNEKALFGLVAGATTAVYRAIFQSGEVYPLQRYYVDTDGIDDFALLRLPAHPSPGVGGWTPLTVSNRETVVDESVLLAGYPAKSSTLVTTPAKIVRVRQLIPGSDGKPNVSNYTCVESSDHGPGSSGGAMISVPDRTVVGLLSLQVLHQPVPWICGPAAHNFGQIAALRSPMNRRAGIELDGKTAATIAHVVEGSPAQRAGFLSGDLVRDFGDYPGGGAATLGQAVARAVGMPTSAHVRRNGRDVPILVSDWSWVDPGMIPDGDRTTVGRLGIAPASPAVAWQHGVNVPPPGWGAPALVVTGLDAGDASARQSFGRVDGPALARGDLIVGIRGSGRTECAGIQCIKAASSADRVWMTVLRDGHTRVVEWSPRGAALPPESIPPWDASDSP